MFLSSYHRCTQTHTAVTNFASLSLSISTHFFSLPLPSLLLPLFSRGGFLWDKCHVMVLWLHNVWFVWLCVRAWEPGCLRTAVTSQIKGLTLTSPPPPNASGQCSDTILTQNRRNIPQQCLTQRATAVGWWWIWHLHSNDCNLNTLKKKKKPLIDSGKLISSRLQMYWLHPADLGYWYIYKDLYIWRSWQVYKYDVTMYFNWQNVMY